MPDKPFLVKRDPKYDGKVFSVSHDTLTWSVGDLFYRDVVHHGGSVAMCVVDEPVVTDEAHIYLVRQYRHAIDDWSLEIPAGTVNRGEEPYTAAVRECEEELGLHAKIATELHEIFPSPGFLSERIRIFKLSMLVKTEQHLDVDEQLDVLHPTIGEVKEMILAGAIKDAKTIIGIALLV